MVRAILAPSFWLGIYLSTTIMFQAHTGLSGYFPRALFDLGFFQDLEIRKFDFLEIVYRGLANSLLPNLRLHTQLQLRLSLSLFSS